MIAGHGPDMFHKFSLMKTALLPSLPLDTPEESEEEEERKEEEE